MKRVLIVTDAWFPQVNGVVVTLDRVVRELQAEGLDIGVLSPAGFPTLPCPTYPEIRLAVTFSGNVSARIDGFAPDSIHIATEGPLGLMARRYCLAAGLDFTTSYHTRFPEYLQVRFGVPASAIYRLQRWFHSPARRMLTPTKGLASELEDRGFSNAVAWSRGVDTALFHPDRATELDEPGPRPVFLSVSRLAPEKNLDAFLELDLPGTKMIVGDGPARAGLEARHPSAVFTGARHGSDLARLYASADVFVFPSRTDTFGLVLLEALASGLAVAAFPVCGPKDVLEVCPAAVLDSDLGRAALAASRLDRSGARAFAERFSWRNVAREFAGLLVAARPAGVCRAA